MNSFQQSAEILKKRRETYSSDFKQFRHGRRTCIEIVKIVFE